MTSTILNEMKSNPKQKQKYSSWTYSQCRAQDEALNMVAIQRVIMAAIVTVTIIVRIVGHMNHLRAVLSVQQHFVHEKYPLNVQENEWLHRKVCHLDDLEVQQRIVDEVAFYVVYVDLHHRLRQLFCVKNIYR